MPMNALLAITVRLIPVSQSNAQQEHFQMQSDSFKNQNALPVHKVISVKFLKIETSQKIL